MPKTAMESRAAPDAGAARVASRVARAVALPAVALMGAGLVLGGASGADLPGPTAVPFEQLVIGTRLISADGLMTLGLLGLACVPAITLLLMLVGHLRAWRWVEAGLTAAVIAVLAVSATVR